MDQRTRRSQAGLAVASAALFGALLLVSIGGGSAAAAPSRAVSARASYTYEGQFEAAEPGNRMTMRIGVRNGHARVKGVVYEMLPATCPASGHTWFSGYWTFGTGIRVHSDRRFSLTGGDGDPVHPSTFSISGRFSKRFTRVTGQFQSSQYFPADAYGPEETCVGTTQFYRLTL